MLGAVLDTLIRGATLVDGTGAPRRPADVGLSGNRIAQVGAPEADAAPAAETIDATGLVLCPGFVDPHTHYDAQLFWDPHATPSSLHGVTSAVMGNCGFSLAPLVPEDADYLRRMLAKVEGMPLPALEAGLPWDWHGFGDYLARLDGRLGLNAGFQVGHCALRRAVMGARAVGEAATPEDLDAMLALLHESLDAGGLGFSTSLSFTHTDGDGQPVPSRWADPEEVLALCRALRDHEGTCLEFIVDGCLKGFTDEEIGLVTEMSLAAGRPANWNVLSVEARSPERVDQQLAALDAAAERGARIVALTMPTIPGMSASFGRHSALHSMPGWGFVMGLPIPERIEKLRDPAVRREMDELAHSKQAGVFAGLAGWKHYRIGTTHSAENEGLAGRTVGEIAAERGTSAFDTLLDIAVADELKTIVWPSQPGDDEASWSLRARVWEHPHAILGGSDAGAHLDRMCGAHYFTEFLADTLRGRKLVSIERAVEMLTRVPAELFGLRERGVVREGFYADLVLFDPQTVGAAELHERQDLPGGCTRLTADSLGIRRVFLNGHTSLVDGQPTGELAGRILHSGRDTYTVAIPGPRGPGHRS